jgi:hypothetical protein
MANFNCCNLVSGLQLEIDGCVISINMNSSTEIIKECESEGDVTGEILIGATKGSMSINTFVKEYTDAVASTVIFTECSTSANLSIPWMTRYDCDSGNDYTQYINTGQGSASVIGEPPYVVLLNPVVTAYPNLTANSSSGPSTVYSLQSQVDGYGLAYNGGPIIFNFNSSIESSLKILLGDVIPTNILTGLGFAAELGNTIMYLQSFNVNYTPGEIPTATFSYAFSLS